jgi:hypothetical protein
MVPILCIPDKLLRRGAAGTIFMSGSLKNTAAKTLEIIKSQYDRAGENVSNKEKPAREGPAWQINVSAGDPCGSC